MQNESNELHAIVRDNLLIIGRMVAFYGFCGIFGT